MSRVVAKIQKELTVNMLSSTAKIVQFSANVLPTETVDPRGRDGTEVTNIQDGSTFSGDYIVTDMTTTYQGGQRTRSLNGIGRTLNGLNTKVLETPMRRDKATSKKK